jgi:hypothetical protein
VSLQEVDLARHLLRERNTVSRPLSLRRTRRKPADMTADVHLDAEIRGMQKYGGHAPRTDSVVLSLNLPANQILRRSSRGTCDDAHGTCIIFRYHVYTTCTCASAAAMGIKCCLVIRDGSQGTTVRERGAGRTLEGIAWDSLRISTRDVHVPRLVCIRLAPPTGFEHGLATGKRF